jgi:hypothetical protein
MINNLFIGGIIGILYYLLLLQLANNMFFENKNIYSMQNLILFLYFGGIIGICVGKILNNVNSSIKIGLYFGSSILLFNALIVHWDNMTNEIKLLLLGLNFGIIILLAQYYHNKNKQINKK